MGVLFAELQRMSREPLPHTVLGAGILDEAASWLAARYPAVLLVCDGNTETAAGTAMGAKLKAAGALVRVFRYETPPLPDEKAVGALVCALEDSDDLILAVGSGTIGDICKYTAWRMNKDFAVVGTAPSMDGYASAGAAMLLDGLKVTPRTRLPVAIFCDTDILRRAPPAMIAAGQGDLLGKYTALADWKLAALLDGEQFNEPVAALVENALVRLTSSAAGAARRDADAIEALAEGLILCGLAMSIHGDSRPASGTEHHLAHFWEMRGHFDGMDCASHGAMVGVGTILALELWAGLSAVDPLEKGGDGAEQQREEQIRALYGPSAETVLSTQNPRYTPETIARCWPDILDIAASLPSPERLEELLSHAEGSVSCADIGVDPMTQRDGILWARERKKCCTILQLLGSMGRLEEFAGRCQPNGRVLRRVKCFVLDLDGTFYLDGTMFPYSLPFLKALEQKGYSYLFFTNNSSRSRRHYLDKLRSLGVSLEERQMHTSTMVLLDWLAEHEGGRRVFVAGTADLKTEFLEAGFCPCTETPDFAVLGFDKTMDYTVLTRLCDFARAGLPVYGVNMDYNCPVTGGFIPDCGSLAAALTAATGVTPVFFGKPSRHTLDYVVQQSGFSEEELCFVGDRHYTDIAVTHKSRARSVMVLSGESRRETLRGQAAQPDLVADNLAGLLTYL